MAPAALGVAVLGMACACGVDDVLPFVRSLRSTGYAGVVQLGVDPDEKLMEFLETNHVRVREQPCREDAALRGVASRGGLRQRRWGYYRQWLEEGHYSKVWLLDVRDVVFQANPFQALAPELGLFVGTEPLAKSGQANVLACLGNTTLRRMGLTGMPSVSGGIVYGTSDGIMQFLDAMQELTMAGMAVGSSLSVNATISYEYPSNPAKNYELLMGARGSVEQIDPAGDALVNWEGMGKKWLLQADFAKVTADTVHRAGAPQATQSWVQRDSLPVFLGEALTTNSQAYESIAEMRQWCTAREECVGFAYHLPNGQNWWGFYPKRKDTGFEAGVTAWLPPKNGTDQDASWQFHYLDDRARPARGRFGLACARSDQHLLDYFAFCNGLTQPGRHGDRVVYGRLDGPAVSLGAEAEADACDVAKDRKGKIVNSRSELVAVVHNWGRCEEVAFMVRRGIFYQGAQSSESPFAFAEKLQRPATPPATTATPPATTATTTAPPPMCVDLTSGFSVAALGADGCPPGRDPVLDVPSCQFAAAVLGKTFEGALPMAGRPRGCYKKDKGNHLVFNNNRLGRAHKEARPICATRGARIAALVPAVCLEGPSATLEQEFTFGEMGDDRCPVGSREIEDLATCQFAVALLDYQVLAKPVSEANRPKGCYAKSRAAAWNSHPSGGGFPGAFPICRRPLLRFAAPLPAQDGPVPTSGYGTFTRVYNYAKAGSQSCPVGPWDYVATKQDCKNAALALGVTYQEPGEQVPAPDGCCQLGAVIGWKKNKKAVAATRTSRFVCWASYSPPASQASLLAKEGSKKEKKKKKLSKGR